MTKAPTPTPPDLDQMIAQRHATHGDFRDVARTAQALKNVILESHNAVHGHLTDLHTEALEMIAHKIARICSGDPDFPDHWDDIAGYATRTRGML